MEQEQLQSLLERALQNQNADLLTELAQQAIDAYPDASFGYYYLGEAYFLNQAMEEGFMAFEKALETEQSNPIYLFRLARNQYLQGQAEAEERMVSIVQSQGDKAKIQEQYYEHLYQKQAYKEAFPIAERLIKLEGQNLHYRYLYAKLLAATEQDEQAIKLLQLILKQDGSFKPALMLGLELYQKLKNQDGILVCFKQLCKLEPRNDFYLYNYAQALLDAKQFEAAFEIAGQVKQLESEKIVPVPRGLKLQADILYGQGKLEEAAQHYKQVIKIDEQDVDAYLRIAEAKAQEDDEEMALLFLETAADFVSPDDAWQVYFAMGKLAEKCLQLDQAKQAYRNILEDSENQHYGLFELARMAHEAGENAFETLRQAREKGSLEADFFIKEHYPEEALKEQLGQENEYLEAWGEAFAKNRQSPNLQKIAGQWWSSDVKKTLASNKMFGEMPPELREVFSGVFEKMLLYLNPQGIVIINPEGGDTRAVYRIEQEAGNKVDIFMEAIGGGNDAELSLAIEGSYLVLQNFGPKEALMNIYLQAKAGGLNAVESKLVEGRKNKGLLDYLGKI